MSPGDRHRPAERPSLRRMATRSRVAAALLRAQLPDVPLREGAIVMARVASRGERHAVIVLAGIPLTAQLPPEVAGRARRSAEGAGGHAGAGDAADRPAAPAPRRAPPPPPARARAAACRRGAAARAAAARTASRPTSSRSRSTRRRSAGSTCASSSRGERVLAEVTTPAGPSARRSPAAAAERLRANLDAVGLDATVKVTPRRDAARSLCLSRTSPRRCATPATARRRSSPPAADMSPQRFSPAHTRPGVPVHRDPELAAALAQLALGQEVPRGRCGPPSRRSWRGPTGCRDRGPTPNR